MSRYWGSVFPPSFVNLDDTGRFPGSFVGVRRSLDNRTGGIQRELRRVHTVTQRFALPVSPFSLLDRVCKYLLKDPDRDFGMTGVNDWCRSR